MKFIIYFLMLCVMQSNGQYRQDQNLDISYKCVNPNNKSSICISLYYCPTLLKIHLTSPETSEYQRFLKASYCQNGFGLQPFVCCTDETTFTDGQERKPYINFNHGIYSNTSTSKPKENSLLASPLDCTARNSLYSYGGGPAGISDYHWMAIIGDKINTTTFIPLCSGSLISHRYVLTVAHCIKKVAELSRLRIRLGEYDLDNEIDCIDGVCLAPVVDVGIEKVIPHKNSTISRNNIALIRLAEEVPYNNNNIGPICLPSTIGFTGSNTDEGLFVAGWGKTGDGSISKIKLESNLPVYDQKKCSEIYQKHLNENITEYELCAGGAGDSVCDGDSGAPLMKIFDNKWVIEGIVSYSFSCDVEVWPSVFTRVIKYEDWIVSNIKP